MSQTRLKGDQLLNSLNHNILVLPHDRLFTGEYMAAIENRFDQQDAMIAFLRGQIEGLDRRIQKLLLGVEKLSR
jgi:hypothetical protein